MVEGMVDGMMDVATVDGNTNERRTDVEGKKNKNEQFLLQKLT